MLGLDESESIKVTIHSQTIERCPRAVVSNENDLRNRNDIFHATAAICAA